MQTTIIYKIIKGKEQRQEEDAYKIRTRNRVQRINVHKKIILQNDKKRSQWQQQDALKN